MEEKLRNVLTITERELVSYFASPLAYVFIVIFLAMSGGLTFFIAGFLDAGEASLRAFFQWHPWLFLFLIPAIGMRLWAEERKSGTIELLMTQPVTVAEAVIGKYLAAWLFIGVALVLTFPIWATVNYLGDPDNGVIVTAYLGSWLMSGAFLGITAAISSLTKNQVIAFVVGAAACFVFLLSGIDMVQSFFRAFLPDGLAHIIANLSIMTNYQALSEGVIDLRNIIYFASLIAASLFINASILDLKKGE